MFSVGSQLPVHVGPEVCEGWGGDAAEGEQFFFGVDGDSDVMEVVWVAGDIPVPTNINVPVVPGAFQVVGLQLVDLVLYLVDLPRDLIVLRKQPLHLLLQPLLLLFHPPQTPI